MEDNKNYINENDSTSSVISNVSEQNRMLDDLELYVGRKKRLYFMPRFEDMLDSDSKVGWNWPALFVPSLWMAYRKMYAETAILIVLSEAISYLGVRMKVFNILSLVLTFLVPALANRIYFEHAKRDLAKIEGPYGEERDMKIIAKGGTSALAVWIVLAISIVIGIVQVITNPELMKSLKMLGF